AKVSMADFTAGSKSAFEMILSAFSVGNLESLKSLISDKILIQFEAEIKDRKSKEETLNTKIISIDNATITNAKMVENFANITVAFTSKQINYIDNTKEEIIVGSKTEINTVNDIWTFKKDCSSLNPNWILITTH
ncbi:MAG: putative lipid-binding transport protein (Tim44 family), partial [Rickettsiales bacterium]